MCCNRILHTLSPLEAPEKWKLCIESSRFRNNFYVNRDACINRCMHPLCSWLNLWIHGMAFFLINCFWNNQVHNNLGNILCSNVIGLFMCTIYIYSLSTLFCYLCTVVAEFCITWNCQLWNVTEHLHQPSTLVHIWRFFSRSKYCTFTPLHLFISFSS